MFLQRIESPGLAHYSYVFGDRNEAAVIDPRRDIDDYLDAAATETCAIRFVFETHRHEDFAVGSPALAERCGAEIWHADGDLDYGYGRAAADGQSWRIGRLQLRAVATPGHTPGSMSYLLHDPEGNPWILFSGDTLFAGAVGRTDLLGPVRAQDLAGRLYDSIFSRLLTLGDGIILCPAHGAGSVCGGQIVERPWTTLGLERRANPRLQVKNREEFVVAASQALERPPYFRRLERWNLAGPPPAEVSPPRPLTPAAFRREAREAQVLDIREETAFAAAHVPDSLYMPLSMLPVYAGWFLDPDRPLLLVGEDGAPLAAARHLFRLGFDSPRGFLAGGMLAWHQDGRDSRATGTITATAYAMIEEEVAGAAVLDVRSDEEVSRLGALPEALHIPLTRLLERLSEVPEKGPVYIFCGSGLRSLIASSLLERAGCRQTLAVLGGTVGLSRV